MSSLWKRLFGLPRGGAHAPGMLGGFVDSLLQGFENRRVALADEPHGPGADAEALFADLYEKEAPRLREAITLYEAGLSSRGQQELAARADELIRRVLVPAYARLAAAFTRRERNDFYLVPEAWHQLERTGWAVAGILVGVFVIWAPFIPLWEKEWILPFALAGLFYPNLRRYFALRRYQAQLNWLVARADHELWRLELAQLTGSMAAAAGGEEGEAVQAEEGPPLGQRLAQGPGPEAASRPRGRRAKEGGG
jgi:hypothetical protein